MTKIHKSTPVGQPLVSSSNGPTERISSFVDSLLQPIAQKQESYIKDTTHFINFIENTPLPDGALLATLNVCSIYTNIPQEEGIEVVGQYYQEHYQSKTPISTQSLGDLMRLILKENSFKFNNKHYLQTHGIAMGTKMAVASFLWCTLKNSYPPSAHINLTSRRDLSLTSSECGPYPKQKSTTLLNSPTHSTPQLNSRMRCHRKRSFSLIPKFLKARGSLLTKSLMFKHILSPQRRSHIYISPHATLSASRRTL